MFNLQELVLVKLKHLNNYGWIVPIWTEFHPVRDTGIAKCYKYSTIPYVSLIVFHHIRFFL